MDEKTREFVKELFEKYPIGDYTHLFKQNYSFYAYLKDLDDKRVDKLQKEAEEKIIDIVEKNEFIKQKSEQKIEVLYGLLNACNKLARKTWAEIEILLDEDKDQCVVSLSSDMFILGMKECGFLFNVCLAANDISISSGPAPRFHTFIMITFELSKPDSNLLEKFTSSYNKK